MAAIEFETSVTRKKRDGREYAVTYIPVAIWKYLGKPAKIKWVIEDNKVVVKPS